MEENIRTRTTDTSETSSKRWGQGERMDDAKQGASRILAAAEDCYKEFGVESSTVDNIAERAGVSRRTVYRYFDSKEAIILAVVEKQAEPFFEKMQQELAILDTSDFRQLLIHCVLATIEYGPQMAGHQLLLGKKNASATADSYLRSSHMRDRTRELLQDRFHDAQHSGALDKSWQLNDLLNWVGRLTYSFIQHPEPKEHIERLLSQYLLPAAAISDASDSSLL